MRYKIYNNCLRYNVGTRKHSSSRSTWSPLRAYPISLASALPLWKVIIKTSVNRCKNFHSRQITNLIPQWTRWYTGYGEKIQGLRCKKITTLLKANSLRTKEIMKIQILVRNGCTPILQEHQNWKQFQWLWDVWWRLWSRTKKRNMKLTHPMVTVMMLMMMTLKKLRLYPWISTKINSRERHTVRCWYPQCQCSRNPTDHYGITDGKDLLLSSSLLFAHDYEINQLGGELSRAHI